MQVGVVSSSFYVSCYFNFNKPYPFSHQLTQLYHNLVQTPNIGQQEHFEKVIKTMLLATWFPTNFLF